MATMISTTAWVLHDLGLAAGLGGSLFGKLALHPAVDAVSSKEERGKVVHAAWRTFGPINLASLGAIAITWLAGRKMLSGRAVGRDVHRLVLLKDALVVGTVVTGVASQLVGKRFEAEAPEGAVPIEKGGEAAPETPERARRMQRLVNVLGTANLAFAAGLVGLTAVLAMKSSRSYRFAAISRLLP